MKTGAIIFSRMNSQRLPGKALIEISGKLLIERVLIAARKIEKIDHICIATSINKDDNLIEEFADKYNVDVYRGDKSDVAMRALNASIKFGYESFIRVCGDRPFIDSHIFNDLINIHSTNFDITTNVFPRSVPPGLSAEVITVKALEKIISMTSDPINREHITKYIYENPNNFKIKSFNHNNKFYDYKNIRLVVDDKVDLEKIRWISEEIDNKTDSISIIKKAKDWELNFNN